MIIIVDGITFDVSEKHYHEPLQLYIDSAKFQNMERKIESILRVKYGETIALSHVPKVADISMNEACNWISAETGKLVRLLKKEPSKVNVQIEIVTQMIIKNPNKLAEIMSSDEYRKLS